MHLIHKIRRSVSHRPRHLFDLPDEILCLILAYCCQDLDFLLWSCPLVTPEGQFCHKCHHCNRCHGASPPSRTTSRSKTLRSTPSTTSQRADSIQDNSASLGNCTEGTHHHDRYNHGNVSLSRQHRERSCCHRTDNWLVPERKGPGSTRPNRDRPPHSGQFPFMRWRLSGLNPSSSSSSRPLTIPRAFSSSGSHPGPVSVSSSLRPIFWRGKSTGRHGSALGGTSTSLTFFDSAPDESPAYNGASLRRTSIGHSGRICSDAPTTPAVAANADNADNADNAAKQKSTSKRSRRYVASSLKSALFPYSKQKAQLPQPALILTSPSNAEIQDPGMDLNEHEVEDEGVQLAWPFQLMLVSKRFARVVTQYLWHELVFHGQDTLQMQALLSTLHLDDSPSSSSTRSPTGNSVAYMTQSQAQPLAPCAHGPRPPYRRFARRVILNFAHPQASPRMLVEALETITSRCQDQVQTLDLHANEKMRAGGLEQTMELERLFGSGFSRLRSLRLQGGFVDNKLLSALVKGIQPYPTSTSAPCRLTHVFLGPGSVTDSAVEKLIAAAGQSLEVFTVTSCVDVGGAAIASLLTKCPKLRVLGVYRSLARDTELLEGLGIEMDGTSPMAPSLLSGAGASSMTTDPKKKTGATRRKPNTIVAPLERLELGTVALTTVGVAGILKGTKASLRFLVLETRHFQADFLKDVVAPYCTKLEGLYFDDSDFLQQHQQTQGRAGSAAGRVSVAPASGRFFEFGRFRNMFYGESQTSRSLHHQQSSQQLSSDSSAESRLPSDGNLYPRPSLWLGEKSTEDWVKDEDCALKTCASGSNTSNESGGSMAGNAAHPSRPSSRARSSPTPFPVQAHAPNTTHSVPAVESDSVSIMTVGTTVTRNNATTTAASAATTPVSTNSVPGATAVSNGRHYSWAQFTGDQELALERFDVDQGTIELVLRSLQGLSGFRIMQMDIVVEGMGGSGTKIELDEDAFEGGLVEEEQCQSGRRRRAWSWLKSRSKKGVQRLFRSSQSSSSSAVPL